MRCKFICLEEQAVKGTYVAIIQRLDQHPKLGPVGDKQTRTSKIKLIDFDHGILITQNSCYHF